MTGKLRVRKVTVGVLCKLFVAERILPGRGAAQSVVVDAFNHQAVAGKTHECGTGVFSSVNYSSWRRCSETVVAIGGARQGSPRQSRILRVASAE